MLAAARQHEVAPGHYSVVYAAAAHQQRLLRPTCGHLSYHSIVPHAQGRAHCARKDHLRRHEARGGREHQGGGVLRIQRQGRAGIAAQAAVGNVFSREPARVPRGHALRPGEVGQGGVELRCGRPKGGEGRGQVIFRRVVLGVGHAREALGEALRKEDGVQRGVQAEGGGEEAAVKGQGVASVVPVGISARGGRRGRVQRQAAIGLHMQRAIVAHGVGHCSRGEGDGLVRNGVGAVRAHSEGQARSARQQRAQQGKEQHHLSDGCRKEGVG